MHLGLDLGLGLSLFTGLRVRIDTNGVINIFSSYCIDIFS